MFGCLANHCAVRTTTWVVLVLLGLLVSPATGGERYDLDTGREVALYSAGLLAGLGGYLVSTGIEPLTAEQIAAADVADVIGFDRISTRLWSPAADKASDILAYGLLATPALLYTEIGAGMSGGDLTVMYTEMVLLEQATVFLIKGAVGRARPFVYNDDPRIPAEYRRSRTAVRSFPSGHTATAFAGAVFTGEIFARLNPDDPARHWVRGTTLVLAAATGWLRIRAGKHYPTDVIVGAIIGSLAGWGIPRLHEVDPVAGGAKTRPTPGLVFGFRF